MLRYFKKKGLVGDKLWMAFKDDYKENIYEFGHAIDNEMCFSATPQPKE